MQTITTRNLEINQVSTQHKCNVLNSKVNANSTPINPTENSKTTTRF